MERAPQVWGLSSCMVSPPSTSSLLQDGSLALHSPVPGALGSLTACPSLPSNNCCSPPPAESWAHTKVGSALGMHALVFLGGTWLCHPHSKLVIQGTGGETVVPLIVHWLWTAVEGSEEGETGGSDTVPARSQCISQGRGKLCSQWAKCMSQVGEQARISSEGLHSPQEYSHGQGSNIK